MVKGYILVKLVPGLEKDALTQIRNIKGVLEVNLLFGQWDVITVVEAATLHEMARVVVSEIRGIQGVEETTTLRSRDVVGSLKNKMTGRNQKAAIRGRYAIAGGLWIMAVALIFSIYNSRNFRQQPLDDGVIILLTVATTILVVLLIAVKIAPSHLELAKSLIWTCVIIVLIYGILGILSIGVFILPAVYFFYFAVAGEGKIEHSESKGIFKNHLK